MARNNVGTQRRYWYEERRSSGVGARLGSGYFRHFYSGVMFRGWRCSVISSGDIIIASGSSSLSSKSVGISAETFVFISCVTVMFIARASYRLYKSGLNKLLTSSIGSWIQLSGGELYLLHSFAAIAESFFM